MSAAAANGAAAAAQDEFAPRSILVTGGAGFIGAHVVNRLVAAFPATPLLVLDKLDCCASLANLSPATTSAPNFKFVKGDVQSADLVAHVLRDAAVDTVLHFAAQTHVDNSFGNSLAFTLNNTYGTHVLLEVCRLYGGVRRFVNVSTDEVYGETSLGLAAGLSEASRLEPTNPYSAAKAGAEMMAAAYFTSYKLPVLTTRGNNVYGPGQFPEKLVPKFALLAARGAPLPIHGDGAATRSYLHVADVAAAFEVVLRKGVAGETYNIGSRRERTVLDVARDIVGAVAAAKAKRSVLNGTPTKAANRAANGAADAAAAVTAAMSTLTHVRDRAFNDRRYFICDEKLAALGWKETVPWERGLADTVEWYLAHGTPEAGHWDAGAVEAALAPHPVFAPGGGGGAPAGMGRAGSGAPPPPGSPGLRPPA